MPIGIPLSEAGRGCRSLYQRVGRDHRKQAHPEVIALQWHRLSFPARHTVRYSQHKRVANLNSAVAKRHGTVLVSDSWNHFTLPVTWVNKTLEFARLGSVRSACGILARPARSHAWRAALTASRRFALHLHRKGGSSIKGFSIAEVRELYDTARKVLTAKKGP